MSFTSSRSHGVYVTAAASFWFSSFPSVAFAKGIFAVFQKIAFASGESASPASPIAPERASGAMRRKGTAVLITLVLPSSESAKVCALTSDDTDTQAINTPMNRGINLQLEVRFIVERLKFYG